MIDEIPHLLTLNQGLRFPWSSMSEIKPSLKIKKIAASGPSEFESCV